MNSSVHRNKTWEENTYLRDQSRNKLNVMVLQDLCEDCFHSRDCWNFLHAASNHAD